jgi:hypothetical protein
MEICCSLQLSIYISRQKETPVRSEFDAWSDTQERERSLVQLWKLSQLLPDSRLFTIFTELRRHQTKFPYVLVFQCFSQFLSDKEQTDV